MRQLSSFFFVESVESGCCFEVVLRRTTFLSPSLKLSFNPSLYPSPPRSRSKNSQQIPRKKFPLVHVFLASFFFTVLLFLRSVGWSPHLALLSHVAVAIEPNPIPYRAPSRCKLPMLLCCVKTRILQTENWDDEVTSE